MTELKHYGVKGMKWGVSRKGSDALKGIPSGTKRTAKADATEHAKAKMFYGEGAGTRRKLIKAKVEARSKDEAYRKAFDHYSAGQNMAKRADQARGERRRKDVRNTTAKTARGVKNLAMQTGAPVTLGAITVYAAMKNPTVNRVVRESANKVANTVTSSPVTKAGINFVKSKLGG